MRDMLRILGARWPLARIVLLPVRVQGVEAPGEIASALRYADQHRVADLIITGRGGGSMEDLWAFNDEGVARARSLIHISGDAGAQVDLNEGLQSILDTGSAALWGVVRKAVRSGILLLTVVLLCALGDRAYSGTGFGTSLELSLIHI